MANSTKKAPIAEGRSYVSQLETVGSDGACAVRPPRHDTAARSSDGSSARATGPAARSRGAHDDGGGDTVVTPTRELSAGNAIRIAVTSSRTEKVTACARKTTRADAASASAATGRGRAPSRATIPNQTRAGG